MKQLQINDVIYRESSCYGLSEYKITRVTKTRAYSGDQGFCRDYCHDCYLTEYPRATGWGRDRYRLGTDKLQAEYTKQLYVKQVSRIKWEDFDVEVLIEVIMLTGE
jgi:hypothetical protein